MLLNPTALPFRSDLQAELRAAGLGDFCGLAAKHELQLCAARDYGGASAVAAAAKRYAARDPLDREACGDDARLARFAALVCDARHVLGARRRFDETAAAPPPLRAAAALARGDARGGAVGSKRGGWRRIPADDVLGDPGDYSRQLLHFSRASLHAGGDLDGEALEEAKAAVFDAADVSQAFASGAGLLALLAALDAYAPARADAAAARPCPAPTGDGLCDGDADRKAAVDHAAATWGTPSTPLLDDGDDEFVTSLDLDEVERDDRDGPDIAKRSASGDSDDAAPRPPRTKPTGERLEAFLTELILRLPDEALDAARAPGPEEMDRLLTARYVKSRSWQDDMMAMFFCAAQNAGEGGMTMACCSMDGQQDLQSTTTFFLDKPPPGAGANGRGLARSPVSFNTHESVKGVKLVPDTDRYYNKAISDVVSAKRKNENYVVSEEPPASKGDGGRARGR
ncbi:hypothetical protein JL720_8091 [Aureococcus anophagefferens]|nr:hypothetical protein JL720_8091 [Aureococcus anophagefferens]